MEPGDYVIIYFTTDPNPINMGNYNWWRGDQYDLVIMVVLWVFLSVLLYWYFNENIKSKREAYGLRNRQIKMHCKVKVKQ